MYEHPIEDVHRLLDTVEVALKKIDRAPTRSLQVTQIPELSEVILELLGWTNTAYMENTLNINPSVLNKFVKMRGVVSKNLARAVADRVRSNLKSMDQKFVAPIPPQRPKRAVSEIAPLTIAGEQWIAIKDASETRMKIGAVASILDSIIEQVKHSNLQPSDQVLTTLERQQLIAILETTLAVLKSPMAERGLLKRAKAALEQGALKSVEKGAQEGLGQLMGAAGSRVHDLILWLFT
ncbi:hypothetical protein [Bradyrhizobium sp. Leo121]|uniref:hypothetical protein n=1 Tax=Bradyrhizobium sp. Leo121 TaxID=1571195 RepID=UPI0010288623|nr:hypothetical protein [Bradyrhizobium sp. Leo121]